MKIIKREKYLERIRPFYKKNVVKIITGQRRVGKSYILKQVIEEIEQLHPDTSILYIDKEKHQFDEINNYRDLYQFIKSETEIGKPAAVFIDEIQEIENFEKCIRSLLSEGNYDIYCTGSNSSIFSSELATLLSGRKIEIKIHSLSYSEFLTFHSLKNKKESLTMYLTYGGLPYLMHLPKEDAILFDYLNNILSTIIYRDIITRNKIKDAAFFNTLISFLADNTGSVFSANSINKYLKSVKINKPVPTIINYLKHMEDANIIVKVRRQDVVGKKIFESGEKYYFEDIGIRNAINGYKVQEINKILENLVFNHLNYLGYQIHIGQQTKNEIDFVAEKNNETSYFQVAYLLENERTISREFGNLDKIKDHYPKYVISMDEFPISSSYKGIMHLELIKFLTEFE